MKPPFTYAAACEAEQAGTITPEGAAWLIGYERAREWGRHVREHTEGQYYMPAPGGMDPDMIGWFTSGCMARVEDQYREGKAREHTAE
jgi:hypothetical protein